MSFSLDNIRLLTNLPGKGGKRLIAAIRKRQACLQDSKNADLQQVYKEIQRSFGQKKLDRKSAVSAFVEVTALGVIALQRTTGLEAYDVQLMGGTSLARGSIVEMKTGEGKTLTTLFPIVFQSLSQQGVHVATVNAYLAERDFEFLKPSLELLGISAGLSVAGDTPQKKKQAYLCDVTFSTGYELGFDFLRDQVTLRSLKTGRLGSRLRRALRGNTNNEDQMIQRGFAAAIIDEVDSVLIDEAVTPLVLSYSSEETPVDSGLFRLARQVAGELRRDEEFHVDREKGFVGLTENGDDFVQEFWATSNSSDSKIRLERPWRLYVESALRAEYLMDRDINYVVRDDKIEIVDEYTGRIFSDRNWRDGLHQAVECKEGVAITSERQTAARISRQRYFQRYKLLCGMTGTATGQESEFSRCYELPVTVIPPRKTSLRVDYPTRYFRNADEKADAVVEEAAKKTALGQPVLIGTRTISQSQMLSQKLTRLGREHQVLNGIQDELEASLIAKAGKQGALTVATNMAGRGTDISPDKGSLAAGGLHVLAYERSSSRRIDRQLIGRAGRQGDPGSGQFFVSSEDDLVTRYDPALKKTLERIDSPDGVISSRYDRRIKHLQERAERASQKVRMAVMQEELWLNKLKKVAG